MLEVGFATDHCLIELAKLMGVRDRVLGNDGSANMIAEAQNLIDKVRLADFIELFLSDAEQLSV